MSLTRFMRRLRPDEPPRTEGADETLTAYIRRVNPRFSLHRHTRAMIEAVEAAVRGDIRDLMVWVPPGTGKSEIVSRLAGSYAVRTRPRDTVGIVSYGALLAQEMTRDAREYYAESGGELDPAQHAKTRWRTRFGGGMWGAGFGGAVRGMRYHLGVVDDPHKGPDDLDSETKRERIYRWWDTTWMNRGHLFSDRPISRIVVMQRLADNDLCGWLLARPDANRWTVLALDAVRSFEPYERTPSGATFLPDFRTREGEALCPERLSPEKLAEQKGDEDAFEAMYQQRPRARAGRILDPSKVLVIHASRAPSLYMHRVVGVDPALRTAQGNDPTAMADLRFGPDGRYYLFRPIWERMEAPALLERLPAFARATGATMIGVESVAYQAAILQILRGHPALAGIELTQIEADRDKETRARGWSWLVEAGLVVLVDDGSGWTERALDEMRAFPRGRNDDYVDAVGIAILCLRRLFERGGGGASLAVGGSSVAAVAASRPGGRSYGG